jgi:broad specificity phosphatase PhoE
MAEILIIRHGETVWNREQVFRGRTDIPLSERGRQQAEHVAGALKAAGVEAIYSSPLARATETAAPLAALSGIEVVVDERLIDMSFGRWEGKARSEIEPAEPELYRIWHESPERFRVPGGESLSEVLARAWPAVEDLAQKHASGRAALVTHRVVCKLLLLAALGAGPDAFWRLRLDTASISAIDRTEREWVVTRLNDTHHLRAMPEALRADF